MGEGEIRLVKRRVSTKNVPPDVTALKLVMESATQPLCDLTDAQLKAEKKRLLLLVKEVEKNEKWWEGCGKLGRGNQGS